MKFFQGILNILSGPLRKIGGCDQQLPVIKWRFSKVGIEFVVQIAQLGLWFYLDGSSVSHCVSELK